jgi:cell division protein FtsL
MEIKELICVLFFIIASFCIAMLTVCTLIIRKKIKEIDKEIEEYDKEIKPLIVQKSRLINNSTVSLLATKANNMKINWERDTAKLKSGDVCLVKCELHRAYCFVAHWRGSYFESDNNSALSHVTGFIIIKEHL